MPFPFRLFLTSLSYRIWFSAVALWLKLFKAFIGLLTGGNPAPPVLRWNLFMADLIMLPDTEDLDPILSKSAAQAQCT
ncbi:hypothetical protein B0H13DRAFT_2337839 [Mycena leptocephala]|nr:hypothetical protein B0H13DRAFT_2337839 [Mycena leptocephala]